MLTKNRCRRYEDVRSPQKLARGLPPGGIKQVDACGDTSVAVSHSGELFIWPQWSQQCAGPSKVPFLDHVLNSCPDSIG